MKKIIIGLDPGSLNFGFSVLSFDKNKIEALDYGVIKINPNYQLSRRIYTIHEKLEPYFKKYNPEYVSIEDVFYQKNVKSTITLAHARAIGLLHCAISNSILQEFAPRKIKLSVTGNGNADKESVKKMVCKILNIDQKSLTYDISDALAIGLCCYYNLQTSKTLLPVNSASKKNRWTKDSIKLSGLKIIGGV